MGLKYFLIVTAISNFLYLEANAKAEIITGSHYENCTEPAKNMRANIIDATQLKIHSENDTHTFLNGTVKFRKGFEVLPGRFYAEMFDRGQWFIQAFDRSYPDLCTAFRDPTQPFYNYCKHFPMCPHKTGFDWNFKMNYLDSSKAVLENMPSHYMGKWRMTVVLDFKIDNLPKSDCLRFPFEIFEV
ncbi:hypothetical protein ACKWTF_009699 [Chironomus riparius]